MLPLYTICRANTNKIVHFFIINDENLDCFNRIYCVFKHRHNYTSNRFSKFLPSLLRKEDIVQWKQNGNQVKTTRSFVPRSFL